MRWKMIRLAPLILAAFAAFVALGGWIVQLLWNGVLPPLFGWPRVTFWQALGLLVLCRILFSGLGGGGHARSMHRRPLSERWKTMTPEERERFRKGIWGRLGLTPSDSEGAGPTEAT